MQSSRTVVGVDIAKRVFQLHWVDVETGEVVEEGDHALPETICGP